MLENCFSWCQCLLDDTKNEHSKNSGKREHTTCLSYILINAFFVNWFQKYSSDFQHVQRGVLCLLVDLFRCLSVVKMPNSDLCQIEFIHCKMAICAGFRRIVYLHSSAKQQITFTLHLYPTQSNTLENKIFITWIYARFASQHHRGDAGRKSHFIRGCLTPILDMFVCVVIYLRFVYSSLPPCVSRFWHPVTRVTHRCYTFGMHINGLPAPIPLQSSLNSSIFDERENIH